jgi:cytochrome c heme-lyase
MGVIVQIHNAVNEQCWQHVLQWERYYDEPCQSPSLVRFQGKPGTPSPKSRILRLLGYQAPFDRHDWVVERCGATVVYVIDFYAGKQQEDKASFYLDVRPRLRDGGWWVRLKRLWHDRMY